MNRMRRFVILPIAMLVLAACQGGGTGDGSPSAGGDATGLLAEILEAGEIRVSTDPAYPPQSFLNEETNELEGFDIDVAKEIGERLGVEVTFETPSFDAVVAGSWADRWDMSVGSVTITPERDEVLDFTQPYYFTPAQMTTTEGTGIESLEDFSGTTVCVGAATTYFFWLDGTLELPDSAGEITDPPADVTASTLETDTDCPQAWAAGRMDFEGWLTALPTADTAIADGLPVVLVGDPVFYEPIAVAFDGGVDGVETLTERVDEIVGEMHEDGTLTELSEKWYEGTDLTTQE
ncbi:MAG: transporter substrate-binding domain-containing protein [Candidatus Limnocylindria bacterium]